MTIGAGICAVDVAYLGHGAEMEICSKVSQCKPVLNGLSKSPAAQAHNGESGQAQGGSIMKARRVQVF